MCEDQSRSDLAQSAVAAAIEAAAQVVLGSNLGLDISDIADDVRALATPDQIAALAAERAATVTVKPLVWAKHPSADIWRCDTMIGTYKVFGGMPSWDFDSATDAKDKTSNTSTSAKLAKAAAQADYDARIRAAITITSGAAPNHIPLPRAEVEALMEAADKIANWTIGGMLADDPENRSKYPLLSDSIISLRKALATLQERMK